ncbi:MAG: hypothetical protein H7X71_00395 [Chitinophagales bacterium]|nr:hypothetical protein [Chitinophagales bacterium]
MKLTFICFFCFITSVSFAQLDTYVGIGPAAAIFSSPNLFAIIDSFNTSPSQTNEMKYPSFLKGATFQVASIDDYYFEYELSFLGTTVSGDGNNSSGDHIYVDLRNMQFNFNAAYGYPIIDERYFLVGGIGIMGLMELTATKITEDPNASGKFTNYDRGFNGGFNLFLLGGYTITDAIAVAAKPFFSMFFLGNEYHQTSFFLSPNSSFNIFDNAIEKVYGIKLTVGYNY